jgi:hypothetical protein
MDGPCSTLGEIKMHKKILSQSLKGRDHLKDLVDERVLLKCRLNGVGPRGMDSFGQGRDQ